jgi:hypothetical protein
MSAIAASAAAQERAVRRTLHAYEQAYEQLNVAAAVAVWPSVNRGALARAFATMASQGIEFESCTITFHATAATASCSGTLQFVRRVGNQVPLTAEQRWVFKLRQTPTDWKIDDVSATQAELVSARNGG